MPVILSGGLRPDNVADAVVAVRPFAVDVNSGVENERGDKNATALVFPNSTGRSTRGWSRGGGGEAGDGG
ncbi:MAG: hypothetical protein JO281_22625 [Pseudonocardiales bacterium]|nr:hypothetical protein [Pseudonocardiales bacterium]